MIRLSMGHIDEYDVAVERFTRQLGVGGVQLHNPSNLHSENGYWTIAELAALREQITDAGLRIDGIENVPLRDFWKIQQGVDGRDEQLDNYITTIRNLAATGYDMLGYNFLPAYVWRTNMHASGRGGARVTEFDLQAALTTGNALADYRLAPKDEVRKLTSAELWSNYQYFLDAVLPVAEAEGVRLALHPDDPPVDEPLGGTARIFTSVEALQEGRRMSGGSPAWGLNFCMGTISELGGEPAINRVIDEFGPEGRIFYVHFRDVRGTVPRFTETFLGDGNFDPARVLSRLENSGFDGFVIDDHVPAVEGDLDTWGDTSSAAYCSRGRAHAIGYLQGVLGGLGLGENAGARS